MYAVFKTGGKQYRATQGQKVKLEKITANSGDKVLFTEVLMVGEGGDDTPWKLRFASQFKGQLIPFGAAVDFLPVGPPRLRIEHLPRAPYRA